MKNSIQINNKIIIENLKEKMLNSLELIVFAEETHHHNCKCLLDSLDLDYYHLSLDQNLIKYEYLYKEFKTVSVNHTDRWILIGSIFTDNKRYIIWYEPNQNEILTNYSLDEFLIDLETNLFDIVDFKP